EDGRPDRRAPAQGERARGAGAGPGEGTRAPAGGVGGGPGTVAGVEEEEAGVREGHGLGAQLSPGPPGCNDGSGGAVEVNVGIRDGVQYNFSGRDQREEDPPWLSSRGSADSSRASSVCSSAASRTATPRPSWKPRGRSSATGWRSTIPPSRAW